MGADYFAVSVTRQEALSLPRKMGGYVWYNCEPCHDQPGKVLTPADVADGFRDYIETRGLCPSIPDVTTEQWEAFAAWVAEVPDPILYSDVQDFPRPWEDSAAFVLKGMDEWKPEPTQRPVGSRKREDQSGVQG